MASIRIKWDPEILADGFVPSSIFDEAEAINTMVSTTMVPVGVVNVQSTAAAAHPVHNATAGLSALVEEMVKTVADLATNLTTTSTLSTTTTTSTPSWSATPTTIIRRAAETASRRPEIAAESVSIGLYIY